MFEIETCAPPTGVMVVLQVAGPVIQAESYRPFGTSLAVLTHLLVPLVWLSIGQVN